MTITVNIAEAKAQLSQLVDDVWRGQRVVIARRGTPVATLSPANNPTKRELGFMAGSLPASFFDPLPDDELEAWGM